MALLDMREMKEVMVNASDGPRTRTMPHTYRDRYRFSQFCGWVVGCDGLLVHGMALGLVHQCFTFGEFRCIMCFGVNPTRGGGGGGHHHQKALASHG